MVARVLSGALVGGALVLAAAPAHAAESPTTADHQPWDGWHAWPIIGHDTWTAPSGNVVEDRWSSVWPLFQFWRSPLYQEVGFAFPWPLFGVEWGPEYTHWRLLPAAAYWRWGDEHLFAAVPLGIATWSPEAWSLLAPLFFGQQDAHTLRLTVFPVFWWFDERDGGLRSVWPLFHARWHTPPDGPHRFHLSILPASLLPIGAWWAEIDHDDTFVGVGWPLLLGYRAHADVWSCRILLEGLVLWSEGGDHFGWRILGGLFRYESRGARWTRWSIFWGLFTREITDRTLAPRP